MLTGRLTAADFTMCFLDKGVIVYVELLSFTVKRQHFESHETLQLI